MTPASRQIVETISVNQLIGILQSAGFTATLISEEAAGDKFIEASLSGGTLYFVLRDCSGQGVLAGCSLVQPFGRFEGDGVTLAQINQYNLQHSRLALAGLDTDGDGIIGAKIYLVEGVTPESFFHSVALFLLDVDTLFSAILPGPLAEVSYSATAPAPAALSKIVAARGENPLKVNAVGARAPRFLTDKTAAAVSGR